MLQEQGHHLREEEGMRREADKLRADMHQGHQQAAGNQVHQEVGSLGLLGAHLQAEDRRPVEGKRREQERWQRAQKPSQSPQQ